jgi:hypothetical protein
MEMRRGRNIYEKQEYKWVTKDTSLVHRFLKTGPSNSTFNRTIKIGFSV